MHGRQQDVHQSPARKGSVHESEQRSEEPSGVANGEEDSRIETRKDEAVHEMQAVADDVCPGPVFREDRAQEKRDIHSRQTELLSEAQPGREHHGPHEAPRECSGQAHPACSAAAIETAALISPKSTRPSWK